MNLPDSERLRFRDWTPDDLELAQGLWGDPQVTARISAQPFDAERVRARLEAELTSQREHAVAYWPIFLKADGTHAGCCGLHVHEDGYELGFHLRPAVWGQGLASEAAGAVVHHAFAVLEAPALYAGHHPENGASKRILGKLGFEFTHAALYPPTGLEHPWYKLLPPS